MKYDVGACTKARDDSGTKRSLVIDHERNDISFSFFEKQGRDGNRKREKERERERRRICSKGSDEIWKISTRLAF